MSFTCELLVLYPTPLNTRTCNNYVVQMCQTQQLYSNIVQWLNFSEFFFYIIKGYTFYYSWFSVTFLYMLWILPYSKQKAWDTVRCHLEWLFFPRISRADPPLAVSPAFLQVVSNRSFSLFLSDIRQFNCHQHVREGYKVFYVMLWKITAGIGSSPPATWPTD